MVKSMRMRLSGHVARMGWDEKYKNLVGFEVLTAVNTKMAVFWVVAPCSLVEVYKKFSLKSWREENTWEMETLMVG
jgi:hypothetical protein